MEDNEETTQEQKTQFQNFIFENAGKTDLIESIIRDILRASQEEGFNSQLLEKYDLLISLKKLIES